MLHLHVQITHQYKSINLCSTTAMNGRAAYTLVLTILAFLSTTKASDQVAKKPPQEVKQPSSKLNNVKPTSAAPKSEKSTPTTSPHVASADARSLDEKIADKKEDIAAAEYKVLCEIRQLALNLKKSGRVPCSYCQEQLPKNPLESNGFMYCCDLCRQLDDAEHPSRSESTNCSPKPD